MKDFVWQLLYSTAISIEQSAAALELGVLLPELVCRLARRAMKAVPVHATQFLSSPLAH